MEKKAIKGCILPAVLALLMVSMQTTILKANVIPLTIFTNNGAYFDGSGLDLYVKVTPLGSQINFEIHNESLIESAIARIYFDDNHLLSFNSISEGPGTSFSNMSVTPQNLPAGQNLNLPFEADYSFGAANPAPKAGINPGQWIGICFDLVDGVTAADVFEAMYERNLRIGVHVTSLPDGSSEAGSTTNPEPATICLLGFGALSFLRKAKRFRPQRY